MIESIQPEICNNELLSMMFNQHHVTRCSILLLTNLLSILLLPRSLPTSTPLSISSFITAVTNDYKIGNLMTPSLSFNRGFYNNIEEEKYLEGKNVTVNKLYN